MGESLSSMHLHYSTVTGYFLQDDPATDPSDFDYVREITSLSVSWPETKLDYDKIGQRGIRPNQPGL